MDAQAHAIEDVATVELARTGTRFGVCRDETVLGAAWRHRIRLASACGTGTCGACKVRVVSGRVRQRGGLLRLSAQDVAGGHVLACCSYADSPLVVLDSAELPGMPDAAPVSVPARVVHIEAASEDVMRLTLRLPARAQMRHVAGQFLTVQWNDGRTRAFSMANAARDDGTVVLHIGRVAGGVFTGHVFTRLREGDVLRVQGAFGDFRLREGLRPRLFIAGGTGIAPILAMLEQMPADPVRPSMRLYWGTRNAGGLYAETELREQARRHGLSYVPVLSGRENRGWVGRLGLVHEAVLADGVDVAGADIYVCGSQPMVDAARTAFAARGMTGDRFFSDSFLTADTSTRPQLERTTA